MKKLQTWSALTLAALLTACSNNDNLTPSPANGHYTEALLFNTSVTNPDGKSGVAYMQAINDTTSATYNNRNAEPIGYETALVVQGKNIYSMPSFMGGSKSEVTRWQLNAQNKLVKQAALAVPAASGAAEVLEISATKAYLTCQGLGKIIVFNPQTMTKTTDIDLNSYARTGAVNVGPAAMVKRDGKVFVGLSQFDNTYKAAYKSVDLVMIDAQTDKVEKLITNETLGLSCATRPIDASSIFVDEQGDIYIMCLGAFGFNSDYPGGIVRIKKGATEIDATYRFRLDETAIDGLDVRADYVVSSYYAGNGLLYAYVSVGKLDPKFSENPYIAIVNCPATIDLKTQKITRIKELPIGNPYSTGVCKYKDVIIWGSTNKEATGFYYYNPTTKKVKNAAIKTVGFPGFIYHIKK